MRKNLLFAVCFILSVFSVSAQQAQPAPQLSPDAKVDIDLRQLKSYYDAGWYIPAWDLLEYYFQDYYEDYVSHYANLIFPDSIVKYEGSSGTISYNWLIAVGQDLDPTSEMYENALYPSQDYRVDSVFVLAWYNMVNTSVVDTLIAEFVVGTPLTEPHFAHTIYVFSPETLRVSPPKMLGDPIQKGYYAKLTAPDKIIVKYPLTLADSTMLYGKYIQFPVDIEVPAGKIIGMSLSFVPGYDYNFDDVLYSYMQGGLTQQHNAFRVGLYSVDNTNDFPSLFFDPFEKYNMNCYIHKTGRYSAYVDQWRNERMASLITWGFDIGWKVSAWGNISVGDEPDNTVSLFPNPADDFVNISLPQPDAMIQISNLHGQLVYAENVMQNNVVIDVSQWPQGMYFANITIKGVSYNVKFLKN